MQELLTTRQMAEADRLTIASGIPGIDLMENAGRAVADAVTARFRSGERILVIAGPGNNGGDGFVAARILRERGFLVQIMLLGEPGRLRGDAALAYQRWDGPIDSPTCDPGAPAAIIDALFGAGLDRPLDGQAASLVTCINAIDAWTLAVDLPSGVSGDSGAVMGSAVEADATITFFRKKPGHLLLPGRLLCGAVTVADIGIKSSVLDSIRPNLFVNEPGLWARVFPTPKVAGHKYSRGHAVVVSGSMSHTGAARLAARAALRAGAGLVTLASPPDAMAVNAATNLAVMVRGADGAVGLESLLSDDRINVVVLGPGGGVGSEMRAKVRAAASGKRTIILDADALTSFVDNPQELFTIRTNHPEMRVIHTPHEGEFDRLFRSIARIPSVKQKLEACLAASHETAGVVLVKGPDTVVAAPDGRAGISDNAPPWLATAGSGDVLAGLIAGLCAQGMPAFEAAAAAVWLHGEAAREFGPGLIAEDLTESLPAVYRKLFSELGKYRSH